jgi:hypothetical protein
MQSQATSHSDHSKRVALFFASFATFVWTIR